VEHDVEDNMEHNVEDNVEMAKSADASVAKFPRGMRIDLGL
jgi:hypothetical protein